MFTQVPNGPRTDWRSSGLRVLSDSDQHLVGSFDMDPSVPGDLFIKSSSADDKKSVAEVILVALTGTPRPASLDLYDVAIAGTMTVGDEYGVVIGDNTYSAAVRDAVKDRWDATLIAAVAPDAGDYAEVVIGENTYRATAIAALTDLWTLGWTGTPETADTTSFTTDTDTYTYTFGAGKTYADAASALAALAVADEDFVVVQVGSTLKFAGRTPGARTAPTAAFTPDDGGNGDYSLVQDQAGVDASTLIGMAAEIETAAAADADYNVDATGAAIAVEAKTAGVAPDEITWTFSGRLQQFSVAVHGTPGRAVDTAADVASQIAASASSDPKYRRQRSGSSIQFTHLVPGATTDTIEAGHSDGATGTITATHSHTGTDGDVAGLSDGPLEAIPAIYTGTVSVLDTGKKLTATVSSPHAVYDYTILLLDTPETAAQGLVDVIGAANAGAGDPVYAFARNGASAVATKRVAGATAVTVAFTAESTAVISSENTQNGENAAVDPAVWSHTVVYGDTLTTIAADIAAQMGADPRFTTAVQEDATTFKAALVAKGVDMRLYFANSGSEGGAQAGGSLDTQAVVGTGLATAALLYVDADGLVQKAIVGLDGTSNVALPPIALVLGVRADGDGGAAVGTVAVVDGDDNVFAQVEVGSSEQSAAVACVPSGQIGHVSALKVNSAAHPARVLLVSSGRPGDAAPNGQMNVLEDIAVDSPAILAFDPPIGPLPAGSRIFAFTRGQSGCVVTAEITGYNVASPIGI